MAEAHGKICYLEIPSTDIQASVRFYEAVFGWTTRSRGDGSVAFDDGVEVGGAWVLDRPPMREPGLLVYVMVDDAVATAEAVAANGGEIVRPVGTKGPVTVARFRDPAGNLLGLYQRE